MYFSSCTLFINATKMGVRLHFGAANTNTSSPRGHNHRKHGVFIDKLPTPPYLIHKIFIHLIFTQPKYLPPTHYTTPTIFPTIYHFPNLHIFDQSIQTPKIITYPKHTRNFPESSFLPSRIISLSTNILLTINTITSIILKLYTQPI